jgi:hypothetical protein
MRAFSGPSKICIIAFIVNQAFLRTKNIHLSYLSNSPITTKVAWEWVAKSQQMWHRGQWKLMVSMALKIY